jgi:hypothetical protein
VPSTRPPPPVALEAREEREAPPTILGQNRMVIFGAVGVLVLLVLGLVGFLMTRPPATGFIMVELPQQLKGKAKVSLNAQPASVSDGVVLQPINAGPVVVAVSAEGYKAFTQTVTVQEGQQVTRVVPEMESTVKSVSLVLATTPVDAQVTLNGKVIRAQGAQSAFVKDQPAADEMVIEVRAPGYKPFQQKYAPPTGSEPLQVTAKLEPSEVAVRVESEPAGATILASGKELGAVTPATVKLPVGVKQVTLRLRCFEETELPVNPSTSGDSPAVVKGALKKQPGCK